MTIWQQIKDGDVMKEPIFECANVPVAEASRALGMDRQTLRLLLQNGVVPWGFAYKLPGSSHYSYHISPKKFFEETGFCYQPDKGVRES